MKKVLIAGDSFAFGHGCSDRTHYYDTNTKSWVGDDSNFVDTKTWRYFPSQYCWGNLVQKEYSNCTVINLSIPGADNTYILDQIVNNCNDVDLVLCSFTGHNRIRVQSEYSTEQEEDKFPGCWVLGQPTQNNKDYTKAQEYFLKYLYSEKYFLSVALSTVFAAYGICKLKNIPFYWAMPFLDDVDFLKDQKHIDFANKFNILADLQFASLNDYKFCKDENNEWIKIYRSVDGHVNDKGHEYYYQHIIKPVVSKHL